MSRFESIPPALSQTSVNKAAHLYVSTEATKAKAAEHTGLPNRGKWFLLGNYTSKAEFIADATDFAVNDLGDKTPTLVFSGVETGFERNGLFDYETSEPTEDLWTIFTLSDEDLKILNSYMSFYEDNEDGVADMLAAAKSDFIGVFATDKDFVIHKLRHAGATDEVLDMLGDACDWDKLETTLNYGFMHNRHYFHL